MAYPIASPKNNPITNTIINCNLVKDESGELLADSHNFLNRCKYYFCQVLNEHDLNDAGKKEMHTANPLVPESESFDVELGIEKL
jgi:hypothetical protein